LNAQETATTDINAILAPLNSTTPDVNAMLAALN
jgi:hypothetical protein